MNLQQKRKQLRGLIPTGKDVSMGCEIEFDGYKGGNPDARTGIVVNNYIVNMDLHGDMFAPDIIRLHDGGTTSQHAVTKIIGHPPRLNDLLRVLKSKRDGVSFDFLQEDDVFRDLWKHVEPGWNIVTVKSDGELAFTKYDIDADPLSQDEETTDKLIELLSND